MAGESSLLGSVNPIAAGLSLVPAIFKGISAIGQKRQANRINPVDPGYQMNNQVINNARILENRYNNYQMPGFGAAQDQINSNATNAFNMGSQGASSSGDILDLVSKINYQSNQSSNDLSVQNAIGKENALGQSLEASALAGEEYQALNAYQRQRYEEKLREKAALIESSNQNAYGAFNDVATLGTSLLNPKKAV